MAEEVGIQEKRRFIRLNTSVDVQYTVLEKSSVDKLNTKSKNISSGGICIIASDKLENNDILGISIYLPGEPMPLAAKGSVAWSKPFQIGKEKEHYDVGVEFIQINPEDRKKINQYVFSLIKK